MEALRERRPLTASERLDWLRLIRTENVGPVTFHQLLARYGSAEAAIDALPVLAARGGRARPIAICPRARAEREIEATAAADVRFIASCEPDYPAPLAAIEDAPPLIAVRGHAHLLRRPAVAVVGARNASANGRRIARDIAAELGRADILVVSGMARGIDAAAHAGALENGTAAVLAGGADVPYPREVAELYEEIVARGVVVSEMPVGSEPQGRHFPRRNRIISGLSLGVVVIEAAARSGSLITARRALDQGREVFAVPGSPLDPRSHGANRLIRDGAMLTESADDILRGLEGLLRAPIAERTQESYAAPAPPKPDDSELAEARALVAELVGPEPVSVDEVVRQCQMSASVVAVVLLELELAGRLERHSGNRVSLVA